jgi:hypothetical protein
MAIAPKTNELRPRLPETAANPLLAKRLFLSPL